MKSITVYDVEAEQIEKICDQFAITEAELIEALMSALEHDDIRIEDYI